MISPAVGADGGRDLTGVATRHCAQPEWSGSRPRRLYPACLIPSFFGIWRAQGLNPPLGLPRTPRFPSSLNSYV